jgi:parvulin-like peptidyl-prolyl isomerase
MSHPFRGTVLAAVCAGLLIACGSPAPSTSTTATPAARVGPDTITLAVFDARLQSTLTSIQQAGGPTATNSAMQTDLRASVMRSLILDSVIAQEARSLGIGVNDEQVDAQVNAAAKQEGSMPGLQSALAQAGGSITQLRDEIRSELNEQRLEDYFANQRAAQVEQQLASGASFASLVDAYSDDTGTNTKGGDLGALSETDLKNDDPVFVTAVKSLAAGAYTKTAVHDSGGYDIVELYAKTSASWSVRHILIAAPEPYTVKDRPQWFAEALFSTVAQLCQQHEIHIFIKNAGTDPCSAAASPAPSQAPTP